MDASEHIPGCDLNHAPRQQCSSWEPPNRNESRTDPSGPRRTGPGGIRRGCLISSVVFWGFVLVLVLGGGLFVYLFSSDAPNIPAYAKPMDSTDLGSITHRCDLTGGDFDLRARSSRVTLFGTNRTFDVIKGELTAEFEARGWRISTFTGPEELAAFAPNDALFIRYDANDPFSYDVWWIEPSELEEQFATYIAVVVHNC